MHPERYIYDALYGRIKFPDYVWRVLSSPELQRLREVRLCNINSLCLTGGANTNRYEHALGTAYLAVQCTEKQLPHIAENTKANIVLAALLHDIGSAAFGHSVQYVLDPQGFKHESFYNIVKGGEEPGNENFRYQRTRTEPIFFGMPRRLPALLPDTDLRAISEMVEGRGDFGTLINGSIDLDNIDNVFRLAFHYGFTESKETPLRIAQALKIIEGRLFIEEAAIPLLQEWYATRRKLYTFLLLNPEEFSAKCMLEEALSLVKEQERKGKGLFFNWNDVDYQILERLESGPDEISNIARRLMIGDLFGCAGIFSTSVVETYEKLNPLSARREVERQITKAIREIRHSAFKSASVAVHLIKDVNKTQRQFRFTTNPGNQEVTIGKPTKRVLIGVFFRNMHLSMLEFKPSLLAKTNLSTVIKKHLSIITKDENIEPLHLYSEGNTDND